MALVAPSLDDEEVAIKSARASGRITFAPVDAGYL